MKTKFRFNNELAGGATDVFLGLVLFFIVLPIGGCIFFASCGAIMIANAPNTSSPTTAVIPDEVISNKYVESKEAHDLRVAQEQRNYQEEQKRIAQAAESERLKEKERLEKLFEIRKHQAFNGSLASMLSLGKMLINGEGTEINEESGLKWIKTAASMEYSPAVDFLKEREIHKP
jgi:hypothetical protein